MDLRCEQKRISKRLALCWNKDYYILLFTNIITMKLRLRYLFVFALGMACMYWLVRSGALMITPIFDWSVTPQITSSSNTFIDTGIADEYTGAVTSWSSASGGVVDSGVSVEQTASMIQWSGDLTASSGVAIVSDTSAAGDSKEVACTKPNGSYNTPLLVSWNETLTAKTTSYIKLRNFLHYIVNVSNGERYYFYHNCSNGVATAAKRVYGTTQIAISNWQIYFK